MNILCIMVHIKILNTEMFINLRAFLFNLASQKPVTEHSFYFSYPAFTHFNNKNKIIVYNP